MTSGTTICCTLLVHQAATILDRCNGFTCSGMKASIGTVYHAQEYIRACTQVMAVLIVIDRGIHGAFPFLQAAAGGCSNCQNKQRTFSQKLRDCQKFCYISVGA
jgi:hypothetical protein